MQENNIEKATMKESEERRNKNKRTRRRNSPIRRTEIEKNRDLRIRRLSNDGFRVSEIRAEYNDALRVPNLGLFSYNKERRRVMVRRPEFIVGRLVLYNLGSCESVIPRLFRGPIGWTSLFGRCGRC